MMSEEENVKDGLADEVDAALRMFWSGSGAALEELVTRGAGEGERNGHGVAGAMAAARRSAGRGGEQRPAVKGYEIIGELGRGGMGVVYKAMQEHPRREVALKVMPVWRVADGYHRALFEREIEALGMLSHENVARLYQAGATEDGRAYFAMELADGRAITEHAEEKGLGIRERVELFVQVCEGVQHAHQRGVIHRDLKVSNIMVTGSGVVKVLDFGLARLVAQGQRGSTVVREGAIKGTMASMSPEQARGDSRAVDARSDVYGLGVVMYELMTGRPPLELSGCGLSEALRKIEQEEPRLLGQVDGRLRGDLEAIVGKAMEKEAGQRYGSVAQLSEDLQRYLADEVVLARPQTGMYALRKLARRHKRVVWGAGATAGALVLGLAGTSVGLMHAREAKREAERAEATAERVNEFLNQMLGAADPNEGRGAGFSVRQMMEQAVRELDGGALAGQAEAEAEVRATVGGTLESLGLYDAAGEQFARALELTRETAGVTSLEAAAAELKLAGIRTRQERWGEAEELIDESGAIRRAVGGDDAKLGREVEFARGRMYMAAMKLTEARAVLKEVLAEATAERPAGDTLEIADLKMALGWVGTSDGEIVIADSQRYYEEALAVYRKEYGEVHDRVAYALVNLGNVLTGAREYAEAEAKLMEARQIRRTLFGEDHPGVATVDYNLGNLRKDQGRAEEALEFYMKALVVRQRHLSARHYWIERTQYRVGQMLLRLGRPGEAERYLREAEVSWRVELPAQESQGAILLHDLGEALIQQKKYEEAEAVVKEEVELVMRVLATHEQWPRKAMLQLARVYKMMGKEHEEADWKRKAEATTQAVSAPGEEEEDRAEESEAGNQGVLSSPN